LHFLLNPSQKLKVTETNFAAEKKIPMGIYSSFFKPTFMKKAASYIK
jgi:hypothetical protein